MASHMTISKGQTEALHKFLEAKMPKSIDKLAEEVGAQDALKLIQLRERVASRVEA